MVEVIGIVDGGHVDEMDPVVSATTTKIPNVKYNRITIGIYWKQLAELCTMQLYCGRNVTRCDRCEIHLKPIIE